MPNKTKTINEQFISSQKRLGRLPRKSDPRSLMLAHYKTADIKPPPKATNFWSKRSPFSFETWGNDEEGCCTIAKQANMARRMERLERKRTIHISTEEVHRVYRAMTQDLYGGGDTGAYEEDALSWTRDPEKTFKDSNGHPITHDAYLRVNAADQLEMKQAIAMAAGHGIAICINLPIGFETLVDRLVDWDFPDNTPMIGDWLPGSWGGHSMWAIDYSPRGILLEQTWGIPPQWITWRAAAAYIDEAHIVIDSVDAWLARGVDFELDIHKVVSDVNNVSAIKIAA